MISATAFMNRYYEMFFSDPVLTDFYDGSGYANLGYWEDGTPNARAACDNLVDKLVELLPAAEGSLLEVACGRGATTRRLAKHFGAENITAINVSEPQLAAARERCPGARFLKMDATDLRFGDASFGQVICIEAALHFDTRKDFLDEALRVLEPGGHLVLSDLIVSPGAVFFPLANYLPDLAAYERLVVERGFVDVHVEDAHRQMWKTFRERLNAHLVGKTLRRRWLITAKDLLICNIGGAWALQGGLLLRARKPSAA